MARAGWQTSARRRARLCRPLPDGARGLADLCQTGARGFADLCQTARAALQTSARRGARPARPLPDGARDLPDLWQPESTDHEPPSTL